MIDDKAVWARNAIKRKNKKSRKFIFVIVNRLYWKVINRIDIFLPDSLFIIWFNFLHSLWVLFLFFLISLNNVFDVKYSKTSSLVNNILLYLLII